MQLPITALILTYNEKRNLEDCLKSIRNHVNQIIIVDSFSTDNTLEIAQKYDCIVLQNTWINYSKQFGWGLSNAPIKNEWVLRIDADERWTQRGFDELKLLMDDSTIDGIYVKMKIYFMGRPLNWGGMYPNLFLRVFKKSKGYLEDRWMDEHIVVEGKTVKSGIDVIESNYDRQENLSLWIHKHNGYSTREAVDFLIKKHRLIQQETMANFWGNKLERKRWIKEKLYFKTPYLLRPFLYFTFRYFFQLGFLDGYTGFIFHYLHAFWYRFVVDVKAYQIEQLAKKNNKGIREILIDEHNITI